MLRYHHRLVGLLIACVLILMAPAAVAGKSTATQGRDSSSENGCRGRGSSREHPHKDRSKRCEQDDAATTSEDDNQSSHAKGNGNGRRNSNGRGQGGPPGKGHGGPPENGNGRGRGGPPENGNGRGHGGPPENGNGRGDGPPGPHPHDNAPPVEGGPALLAIDVNVDHVVAQVGTVLTYDIEIANSGPTTTSLTVTNDVPAEVTFLSSTEPTVTADANSVTWTLPAVDAGSSTTIQWTGRVARLGDLDAVNVVTVDGKGADPAPVETHTYLASVQGVRVQRAAAEPDWGSHSERRVVFRAAAPHAPSTAGSSGGAPAQLPRTGVNGLELVLIAALLMLGGLVLIGRAKRHAAAAMMVVLIAAACTSEPPQPDIADSTETPAEEDEVLGTRIGPGTPVPPGSTPTPETDNDPAEPGADATEPQGPAPGAPDVADAPGDEVVREVVLVTVPNEPPEPQPVGTTDGANSMSLTWDEPSRSITSAASSRMLTAGAKVDVLATVSDAGDGMNIGVSLTNITSDERVLVRGHLIVDVTGSDGSVVRLSSPPIDEILDPRDEVTADFVLALPSGSYVIDSVFSAA